MWISHTKEKKVKSLSCAGLFATPWTVACTKLLHPWDFPSKSTGVGCHFLLQGIFPTQGSNPGLPHCRQTLYRLSHLASLLTLPPTSPIPPLEVITEYRAELAVLYSSFPLASCFTHGRVYMSVLLFEFALPSPSSPVSASLLSLSVSLQMVPTLHIVSSVSFF